MADGQMSLTEDDVIQFINQMFRLQFKKEELVKPDGPTLAGIYELILNDYGIESLNVPQNALQNIDDLPRFGDWVRNWNLCVALQTLLRPFGVHDFGIRDLLSPTRKRTLRVLSTLIQLWWKQGKMRERWIEIEREYDSKENDKDRIANEIKQLKSQVETKSIYLSQNRSNYKTLEDKLSKLVEEVEVKKMKGDELAEKARCYKQECATKKSEISDLAVKLSRTKEEVYNLEMKLVRSPERVKAETSNKEAELNAKRAEKRQYSKEYMDISKKVDVTRKAINEMLPAMDSLRVTLQELQTVRGNCNAVERMKEQVKAKQGKLQQLKVIEQQNKTNLGALKDQIKRSECQHSLRTKPILEDNERIKKQIAEKLAASGKSAEVDRLLDTERKLQKELEGVRAKKVNFDTKLEHAYSRAQDDVANFKAVFDQAR